MKCDTLTAVPSGGLQFRMLGPLQVLRDGDPIALPPGRPRALLGVLLVHAHQVVPIDRLLEELWRQTPPPSAGHALQVHVSKLRRLLEPARAAGTPGEIIVTRPPGYVLAVPPEQRDASQFEQLLDQGARALETHRPAEASELLSQALALWRGPVLADLSDEPFVAPEAARLEELRSVAIERRAEAGLALGRHRELVSELETMVRAQPYRERLWGLLITALYRSGRATDALHAYQRLRTVLGDELGLEPSPELRRLETAVLRHDPQLAAPAAAADAAPPLPRRLAGEPAVPFIGRAQQRAALERAWRRVESGQPRVVLLAGEPGIGKTRLATELAVDVHRAGGLVLLGTCDEDLAVPYQPFVEALRHLVAVLSDDELARAVGGRGGELLRILPELAGRMPGLSPPQQADPETERYLLFSAVVDVLGTAAGWWRAVLVLDDLQWATKTTLLLLKHLVRATTPVPLLIVGVYRDSEIDPDHPLTTLLADLRREPEVERIKVRGLSHDEGVALVEAVVGRDLEAGELTMARAVQAEADGSPFFVRELVHHLVETGGLGRPETDVGVPDSVREVIAARMSRLSERTRRLLTVAAVTGHEFDADLLAQVTGMERPAVIECLGGAQRAALVDEAQGSPGRYVFVHALVRHALAEELGPARRMETHRLVAEAFESLGGPDAHLSQLAHHWLAALPAMGLRRDDLERAVRYGEQAGRRAMASLAYEEAVNHFLGALRAARQAGDDEAACELLILLGEAQRNAGGSAHRETLLEATALARRLGDSDRVARAALANQRGVYSRMGGVDRERVDALRSALDAVGPAASSVRARLLAGLATETHFEGDARLELARTAVSIARGLGDQETLAQTLAALWFAVWGSGQEGQRGAIAAELRAVAAGTSDRSLQFQAGVAVFLTSTGIGDIEQADEALAGCLQAAAELGQPLLRWRATSLQVHRAMIAGRVDEAERLITELLRLGEATGQPDRLAFVVTPMVSLRLIQGRPQEVAALVEPAIEQFPAVVGYPSLLAWALAADGRADQAQQILDRLRTENFAGVLHDYTWLFCVCCLSRACSGIGDRVAAAELYDLLLPYGKVMATVQSTWIGPVTHDLGLLAGTLGRYDDAERHFAEAVDTQDRIGARATVVHTRLGWARMLLRRARPGDAARARALLDQVRAGALQAGLPAVAAGQLTD